MVMFEEIGRRQYFMQILILQ